MKWVLLLLTLAWLASLGRRRERAASLPVLEPSDEPPDDFLFLVGEGVELDEATRRAAAAHARTQGLDVLDLVPFDLSSERMAVFVALYEPRERQRVFSQGRTARHAIVISRAVAERTELEQRSDVQPLEFVHLGFRLKKYAPRSSDAAIARGLRATVEAPGLRLALLRESLGVLCMFFMAFELLLLTVLALGLAVATPWGIAALLVYHLTPLGIVAGTALRPHDLASSVLLRAPLNLLRWLRLVFGPDLAPGTKAEEIQKKRPEYEAVLAGGVEALFEPRSAACPLCESDRLGQYLDSPDMFQHKPGRFVLDECTGCGHLFQNPRLTTAGLDFYYGDFYDGLGRRQTEAIFGIGDDARYLARAEVVQGQPAPETWLDVGGGYGHFCLVAKTLFPETRFDGLDLSDGIDEGVRRGWIENGYRGFFPDLCDDIPKYDVVSMSHYLEHTRDPEAEVKAACTALSKDGLLLVEMPNGPSTTGKLLGRFWIPFFQPQHQHLISISNLERLMEENGFEILVRQLGEAQTPGDFTGAGYLFVKWIAGPDDAPWLPPRNVLQRLRYRLGWGLLAPLIPLGFLLDRLMSKRLQAPERTNAYRLLARKTA
jgi:SAM-dependent methyltransferase